MTSRPVVVVDDPNPDDISELVRSLVAYNNVVAPPEDYRKIAAFVRDDDDTLVGGVSGLTHWEWLFVGHLWVSESERGSGLGGRLLESIENGAVARNCRYVWLDTFSFQAPEFYKRRGYQEFGVLDDYPPGFRHHYLWKPLPTEG